MKIGAHLLTGKGLSRTLEEARSLGCGCMQVFLHNPRGWQRKKREAGELAYFKKEAGRMGISPVAIHMPYLVNLATPDRDIISKSLKVIELELGEAAEMGASYYVIHPGSHRGAGIKRGLDSVVRNLKSFSGSKVKILLENTAGQGSSVGSRWSELGYIIEKLGGNAGVCLDTAHAFEAGYDIMRPNSFKTMKEEIERNFGLRYILMVHANDSLTLKGSKSDRHQHIGRGYIGLKGFENLIGDDFFGELPYIIETPKGSLKDDAENMKKLKEMGEKHGKVQL